MRESVQPTYFSSWRENWSFFCRGVAQTTFISFARTPLSWPQVNVDLQRYLTRKEFLDSSTPKALWKHSRSPLYALPTHSQCTPNALSNHSQSTPKALPKHSQSAQSRFWLEKLKLCISCSVSLILCYKMRSEPIVKSQFPIEFGKWYKNWKQIIVSTAICSFKHLV